LSLFFIYWWSPLGLIWAFPETLQWLENAKKWLEKAKTESRPCGPNLSEVVGWINLARAKIVRQGCAVAVDIVSRMAI